MDLALGISEVFGFCVSVAFKGRIDWKEEKLSSQTISMIYSLPVQPLQLLSGLAILANIYSGPYFKIN